MGAPSLSLRFSQRQGGDFDVFPKLHVSTNSKSQITAPLRISE